MQKTFGQAEFGLKLQVIDPFNNRIGFMKPKPGLPRDRPASVPAHPMKPMTTLMMTMTPSQ